MPSGAADSVARAAAALKTCCGAAAPVAAIVLGSGLGGLADSIENATRIPYGELLGRGGTVEGHRGEFVYGILAGREVIVLSGRMHLYEGHPPGTAVLPVRIAQAIGARALVLSNAAGGIRKELKAGDFMLIRDHINLMWRNPLIGTRWRGDAPYDAGLAAAMRGAAESVGVALAEGVYAAVLGPSYETPAEIRMLATLGADAVGMSTVPEALVAGALGMPVVAVSCITNAASGVTGEPLSHTDVLDVGRRVAVTFERLVRAFVGRLPTTRAGGSGG
jgi:purine-nucleoside phosphorylase